MGVQAAVRSHTQSRLVVAERLRRVSCTGNSRPTLRGRSWNWREESYLARSVRQLAEVPGRLMRRCMRRRSQRRLQLTRDGRWRSYHHAALISIRVEVACHNAQTGRRGMLMMKVTSWRQFSQPSVTVPGDIQVTRDNLWSNKHENEFK